MENQGMHTNCRGDEPCLPIGAPPCAPPAQRGRSSGPNMVLTIPVLTHPPGRQAQFVQPAVRPARGEQTTLASPEIANQSCAPPAHRGCSPGESSDIFSPSQIQSPGNRPPITLCNQEILRLQPSPPPPHPRLSAPWHFCTHEVW